MPSYDIATTAFAVGASKKWVDNLASHHSLSGVLSQRRGVSREFSFEAVVLVSLIRALCDDLRIPVGRAVKIAASLTGSKASSEVVTSLSLPSGLVLRINTDTMIRQVRQRLLNAAESAPRIRRGRPPATMPANEPAY